jgi:YbgC/YbaW family acyl-CoA thioester hydrolase
MTPAFVHTRRVEFAETDMAGIVHFAQFCRYMEAAEHAFFRSLGFSVHGAFDGQLLGWPRVAVSCEYQAPLRFEDEFDVELHVTQIKARSLVCEYVFRKRVVGEGDNAIVARGTMTTVCAAMDERSGEMKAVAIPPALARRIGAAAKGNDTHEESA